MNKYEYIINLDLPPSKRWEFLVVQQMIFSNNTGEIKLVRQVVAAFKK